MKKPDTASNRNLPVLLALIALLITLPFFETSELGGTLLLVLFTLILIASVYAVSHDMNSVKIAAVLAVPTLLTIWGEAIAPNEKLEVIGYAFMILFLLYTTYMLLRRVLSTREVTMQEVFGAISVYILLGLIFSLAYVITLHLVPTAFNGINGEEASLSSVLYFSFATLTTVGFGDIVAVAPLARSIAIVEMIAGIFYIAVLVSKMVSAMKE